MKDSYELIIIGSGPAGLAASIYATRAQLDSIVIEKDGISGGQIITTEQVDNYPGLLGISGLDLGMKLKEHAQQLGSVFVEGEIKSFTVDNENKCVTLHNGKQLKSKAVIIATGAKPKRLGVPGEEELLGMGVSYCATCDGAFFKNRQTVVVGGGDVAIEDALVLSKICKKVYLVHRREGFRATKSLVEKVKQCENVEILTNCIVKRIIGEDVVEGVVVENIVENQEQSLKVEGVFIAVGYDPNTELFAQSLALDEKGYICAGEEGKTNIPGVFAVGDCRTKQLRQIVTAVSDGANAVTSVERYLNSLEF